MNASPSPGKTGASGRVRRSTEETQVSNPDLPLGPFTIDRSGLLLPTSASSFPAFHVRWRQRTMHTRLVHEEGCEQAGMLEFSSVLGRVPSTAARPPSNSRRARALALLRTLPGLVPHGWKLDVSADHSVLVATTTPIVLPISAVLLVTKVTLFLLALGPYLDVLDAEGVTFIGAGAGMVNT